MNYLKSEEIMELFQNRLGKQAIIDSRIETKIAGIKKNTYQVIWIGVKPNFFKEAVKILVELHYPHFAIISGIDIDKEIELVYHFSIYYGEKGKEISINIFTFLSKDNLNIPTITDLIPGAQTSERETKEMFGVNFEGLPSLPNLFLPYDFPSGVYPLRKDEKGVGVKVSEGDEVKKGE